MHRRGGPEPGGQVSGRRAPERVSSRAFDPRSRHRGVEKRLEGMAFGPPQGGKARERQPWRGYGCGAEGLNAFHSSGLHRPGPELDRHRRRRFPVRPPQGLRGELQRTLSLPQREDSVVPREPRASDLPLLRMPRKEGASRREEEERTILLKLHDEAAGYFRSQLLESKEGAKALDYLKKRGLTPETLETYGFGWAPDQWSGLHDHLARQGAKPEHVERAGLAVPRKTGKGFYDRFRSRVMIPIRGEAGRIVAFGGRILGPGEPKYLNSPESPIYNKSSVLYGFDRAKEAIRKEGFAILMEGYLDCLQAYQAGIGHAVACCGTSLTKGHARLLRRYTDRVVVNFDP